MTQEQLANAREIAAGILETQVVARDLSVPRMFTVSEAIDNELGYLANANPDPIPEEELLELTGNICSKYLSTIAPVAVAITPVGVAVAELVPEPAVSLIAVVPTAEPASVMALDVKVSADCSDGSVTFDAAGFEPIRCSIQAAVAALDGFALAVDELLTPGDMFTWEDASFASAFLHDGTYENEGVAAEIHRDETALGHSGLYVITVHRGTNDPAGSVIGGAGDMNSAKFIAAKAIKASIAALLEPVPEAPGADFRL